jgi:penicillin-binding protein 1A
MDSTTSKSARFTLHRANAGRFGDVLRRLWARRWTRIGAILLALPIIFYGLLWLLFAQGLPSAESLLTYQPALPSNVRDVNGQTVQTFARERRVELAFEEYPPKLIGAFLSAEDRTFFQHGGIDFPALPARWWTMPRSSDRASGRAADRRSPSKSRRTCSRATNIR